MDSKGLIVLIEEWLKDVQSGEIPAAVFVQVVESLIEVYERSIH
jgi:hypothetical protein